jgi:hypothetical protein
MSTSKTKTKGRSNSKGMKSAGRSSKPSGRSSKPGRAEHGRRPAERKVAKASSSAPSRSSKKPKIPRSPRADDLVRPAPNEPVRIQPPPELARSEDLEAETHAAPPTGRAASRDVETERKGTSDSARDVETERGESESASDRETARERNRVRNDPERRPQGDRSAFEVNRWVRQRSNAPRGGRWQAHGHPSVRGR